ncbi:MAG: hypothetical protein ABFD44_12940 [Anaerolineaceae bacterium]
MKIGKTIAYIGAAIMIFFGVLFIWAAFAPSTTGPIGSIIIGILLVTGGLVLIFVVNRPKPAAENQNVTVKIDLPANVNLDSLKCKSCGGVLTMDNIKMVAGAPVVTCPYCNTTYQLTEEPKW